MRGILWITGVSGFSGRHMAAFVAAQKRRPRIIGLDLGDAPDWPLDGYERLDLCDADAVARLARCASPDWVVHLAGLPPDAPAGDLWRGHVASTLGLATGLVQAGCRRTRLLGVGSAAEYRPDGRPLTERSAIGPRTDYGRSKLAQTLLTVALPRTLGLSACVARTFNLVGPGLPSRYVLGRLCTAFREVGPQGTITLQHVNSSRDFVDIRDAVAAYWRLALLGRPGGIYNVCSGHAVSLPELIERLSAATGKHPIIATLDPGASSRPADIVYGSFAKLRRRTGWKPHLDLSSSIHAMLGAQRAADAAGPTRRVRARAAI